MADTSSPIAPWPQFPERTPNTYERKGGPALPGNRGPLRFQEGVATDTDIPNDFQVGVSQGIMTPPGRPNHNQNVFEKWPEETMKQRAHVGSSAWVESTQHLGDFASAAFTNAAELRYEQADRSGFRPPLNPAVVID